MRTRRPELGCAASLPHECDNDLKARSEASYTGQYRRRSAQTKCVTGRESWRVLDFPLRGPCAFRRQVFRARMGQGTTTIPPAIPLVTFGGLPVCHIRKRSSKYLAGRASGRAASRCWSSCNVVAFRYPPCARGREGFDIKLTPASGQCPLGARRAGHVPVAAAVAAG
jgi:hypothetical protein